MRRIAGTFLVMHVLAMILGVAGILVMIPHPELWAGDAKASNFYNWAITHTGGSSMVLGALAVFAWGCSALGWRRTLIFFVVSTIISAGAELTGTKTGWPFGGYEYLSFLGYKLFGRVPYSIPLSWFYMGLPSYVLADVILARRGVRHRTWWAIAFGGWLLTAWDLVLDPAMASPALAYLHFWKWHVDGVYFGMPLRNLVGWVGTGVLFMGVGRLFWRSDLDAVHVSPRFPFAVYAVNVVWSMTISIGIGLWPSAIAALVLSLAPAALAFFPKTAAGSASSVGVMNPNPG